MISLEFLLTSLVVVLTPGTGVLYTVATGLFIGRKASLFAALGCTLGIIPALLASVLGLAAVFHTSAIAFQIIKYFGAAYLLYLAYQMWHSSSPLSVSDQQSDSKYSDIMIRGFLLNILNPKLSIFFLAFLPQFIPQPIPGAAEGALGSMFTLGVVFMAMTCSVFIVYGFLSGSFSAFIIKSEKASVAIQKLFATSFAALGIRLAFSERV
ncbi:lysine transporter LysE [Bacterioplanes sanyensis]|uniref:Lysine transporter LysE n=1 Tax=Bacterioplanes sanyensis TaxID=1249553 RepID=A0A222FNV2_9GAMM|nr:LysE family translocator [Bacterioplanes sanyensis]ASP40705.1 lysine transporter LysE [Bacterioplanes sanyensis]